MRLKFLASLNRNEMGFAFDIYGEGEGFVFDQWISAASLAAPQVAPASRSLDSRSQQDVAVAKAIQSLDSYLALVSTNVGPALAADQLDWSTVLPTEDTVSENDGENLALSLAIDDILGSIL